MTTNREQHELAARAAGLLLLWKTGSCKGGEFEAAFVGDQPWRPKEDDGDSQRLAVTLRLTVSWDRFDDCEYATATPPHTHQGYDCVVDQDPYTAARLAVFRAAVEIGRGMP